MIGGILLTKVDKNVFIHLMQENKDIFDTSRQLISLPPIVRSRNKRYMSASTHILFEIQ